MVHDTLVVSLFSLSCDIQHILFTINCVSVGSQADQQKKRCAKSQRTALVAANLLNDIVVDYQFASLRLYSTSEQHYSFGSRLRPRPVCAVLVRAQKAVLLDFRLALANPCNYNGQKNAAISEHRKCKSLEILTSSTLYFKGLLTLESSV